MPGSDNMSEFADEILKLNNSWYRTSGRLSLQELTLDPLLFDLLIKELISYSRAANLSDKASSFTLVSPAGNITINKGTEE